MKTIVSNLKSNMDRFIGALVMSFTYLFVYLKSNMDRFIVTNDNVLYKSTTFKIQYG